MDSNVKPNGLNSMLDCATPTNKIELIIQLFHTSKSQINTVCMFSYMSGTEKRRMESLKAALAQLKTVPRTAKNSKHDSSLFRIFVIVEVLTNVRHVLTNKPIIIEVEIIFGIGIFNTVIGAADFFDAQKVHI